MVQSATGSAQSYAQLIGDVFQPMEFGAWGHDVSIAARFVSRGDDWLRSTRGSVRHDGPIRGRRGLPGIADQGRDQYLLVTAKSGEISYSQYGCTAVVGSGAMVLLDAGAPYEFERRAGGELTCHQLSGVALREAMRDPRTVCAMPLRADGGLGFSLRALLDSAWDEAPKLSGHERRALVQAVGGLLDAIGGNDVLSADTAVRGALSPYDRARDHIVRHIADPTLDARSVAAAIGVSISHLHASMQRRGTSVGRTIRAIRLDRCAALLRAPEAAEMRISDLAYCWGFADAAHFSRCFRGRFGCSPSTYRDERASTLAD